MHKSLHENFGAYHFFGFMLNKPKWHEVYRKIHVSVPHQSEKDQEFLAKARKEAERRHEEAKARLKDEDRQANQNYEITGLFSRLREAYPLISSKTIRERSKGNKDNREGPIEQRFICSIGQEIITELTLKFGINFEFYLLDEIDDYGNPQRDSYDDDEGKYAIAGFGIPISVADNHGDKNEASVQEIRCCLEKADLMKEIATKYQLDEPRFWTVPFHSFDNKNFLRFLGNSNLRI